MMKTGVRRNSCPFFYHLFIHKMRQCILVCLVLFLSACNRSISYERQELKKRTFHYFWDLADRQNFQIPDRFPTLTFSSIAATGFGLSSYITGIENGYITREQGAERVRNTLKVLWELPQGEAKTGVSGFKGFYYHFLNLDDAKRFKEVELSSIDTGLLMAGVLSVQSYFDGAGAVEKEIRQLADQLYLRVDWNWMMNGAKTMSMGWHPEKGFIPAQWKGYNEAMVLLIMAIGSPTHPIPAESWNEWCKTYEWESFMGINNVQFDPLFGHQYSHIWIDFREIQDAYMKSRGIDYYENSRRATLSNKAYCLKNPGQFIGYGEHLWGLTACDGPFSGKKQVGGKEYQFFDYRARGASSQQVIDDGTIAPTAAGGSMPFAPKECESALANMWNQYHDQLVGQYGFKDAFNLTYKDEKHPNGWFDIDYLGIDQGPILLQMQNHENELIWKVMKKNKYIVEGLKKAGFTGGWLNSPTISQKN